MQLAALLSQRFARHRRFFHHRSIMLGHLVHMVDGRIDLLQTGGLLARNRGNRVHMTVDAVDQRYDLL